jgi:membrane-bound lytic murein transglycosylase B
MGIRRSRAAAPGLLLALLAAGVAAAPAAPELAPFSGRAEVDAFVETLVDEHGFDADALRAVFADARPLPEVIERISAPAERTFTWAEYRDLFLKPERIEAGLAFWEANEATLARAERTFGVPPEMVLAILGVETRYGRYLGRFRVVDALATLAFDYPPRASFFRGELEAYLRLVREEGRPASDFVGSYAGAMGYGQFIPTSYRAYAVDFDGDGDRDIWEDPVDAIGSIANYFAEHGWRAGGEVRRTLEPADPGAAAPLANRGLDPKATVAELRAAGLAGLDGLPGDAPATLWRVDGPRGEAWIAGLHNFRVITRYNHSHLYGLAVADLAEAIRAARDAPEAAGAR